MGERYYLGLSRLSAGPSINLDKVMMIQGWLYPLLRVCELNWCSCVQSCLWCLMPLTRLTSMRRAVVALSSLQRFATRGGVQYSCCIPFGDTCLHDLCASPPGRPRLSLSSSSCSVLSTSRCPQLFPLGNNACCVLRALVCLHPFRLRLGCRGLPLGCLTKII
jgi:hypothetical protein